MQCKLGYFLLSDFSFELYHRITIVPFKDIDPEVCDFILMMQIPSSG